MIKSLLLRLLGRGRFAPTYETFECDCNHPSWKHDQQGGCCVEGCDCLFGLAIAGWSH